MTRTDDRAAATAQPAADRSAAQVRGVDRLARWCTNASNVDASRGREGALDGARYREAVKRQRQAMRDHLAAQPDEPWPGPVPTAVQAHRNDWLVRAVAAVLTDAGVHVAAQSRSRSGRSRRVRGTAASIWGGRGF